MSTDLGTKLDELSTKSEDCDYGKIGFHHRHRAEVDVLTELATAFVKAGYLLEMLTCQDRRETTDNKIRPICRELMQKAFDQELWTKQALQGHLRSMDNYDKQHPPD